MNFVFHQVNELQDIDAAHGDQLVEVLSGPSVAEFELPEGGRRDAPFAVHIYGSPAQFIQGHLLGVDTGFVNEPHPETGFLSSAEFLLVEYLRGVVALLFQPAVHLRVVNLRGAVGRSDAGRTCLFGEPNAGQCVFDRLVAGAVENGRVGAEVQAAGGPTQVGFQHLAQVHP